MQRTVHEIVLRRLLHRRTVICLPAADAGAASGYCGDFSYWIVGDGNVESYELRCGQFAGFIALCSRILCPLTLQPPSLPIEFKLNFLAIKLIPPYRASNIQGILKHNICFYHIILNVST